MDADCDVAIVGGGAAGIAAARRLSERGRSVMLIEALPRLGGRAHTALIEGMALDLGCGWLHSADRNPLAALAASKGVPLDRSRPAWGQQLHDLGFPADDQEAAWSAYEALCERLDDDPPASDRASDAVPLESRWRPFMDGLSSFINGVELANLSARDFTAYEDASTVQNWRIHDGYGAFIAGLAAGLPQALGTRVRSVAHDDGVTLETDRGVIRAKAAVVAVSTAVLAQGTIRFAPAVDDHLHAATSLPLGLADKVFLSLAEPESVPPESHLLGRPDSRETGSYYLRPFGRPLIECFLGGAAARDLERAGPAAAAAFAVEGLRNLLGSRFADGLRPMTVTRWGLEPTIGGSYSHALPGCADARQTLARPISESLCLAGEACSRTDFSTAHGAWQSGLAAADWIERGL